MSAERTFCKMEIGGIVYLVEPATLYVYTYDKESPTRIGDLAYEGGKARVELLDDWRDIMASKLATT